MDGVEEGSPYFADEEEVFALYDAFLDGSGYTAAALDFVGVVWCGIRCQ